jgi:hypothetical protein
LVVYIWTNKVQLGHTGRGDVLHGWILIRNCLKVSESWENLECLLTMTFVG